MLARLILPVSVSALLLSGCANQQAATTPGVGEAMDGAASVCTVTPADLPRGVAATVQMQVGNDGGWCAIRLADKDGTPFSFPLLKERAQHGRVAVNKVGNNSRVEYTPNAGYTGADAFAVTLVPKDRSADVLLRVNVSVAAGPASAAPAPAPTPAASSSTSERSSTTRRSSSRSSSSSSRSSSSNRR